MPASWNMGSVQKVRLEAIADLSSNHLVTEHAHRMLAGDAIAGLLQALAGQFVSDTGLDDALGVTSKAKS